MLTRLNRTMLLNPNPLHQKVQKDPCPFRHEPAAGQRTIHGVTPGNPKAQPLVLVRVFRFARHAAPFDMLPIDRVSFV